MGFPTCGETLGHEIKYFHYFSALQSNSAIRNTATVAFQAPNPAWI
jgi:hypothetical protein